MLLDTFHILNRALTICCNNYGVYASTPISIPQVRGCNGTYYTSLYIGNSSEIYGLFDAMPPNTVRSQNYSESWPSYPANIVIGTGKTAVTPSDYKIESEITSGISIISTIRTNSATEGTIQYVRQYKNTSGEEMTVNEVGFTSMVYVVSKNSAVSFLIYREVLENPIVVPADGYFTIEFGVQLPLDS